MTSLPPQRETSSLPETVDLQPPTDALATPQHGWDRPAGVSYSTARASSPVSQPRQGGSGAVEAPQQTSEVRDVDTARAGFPEPRCAMQLSGTVEQKPDALIIANARRLCASYSLHTAQRGHKATKALRQRLESATQAALAAEVRHG